MRAPNPFQPPKKKGDSGLSPKKVSPDNTERIANDDNVAEKLQNEEIRHNDGLDKSELDSSADIANDIDNNEFSVDNVVDDDSVDTEVNHDWENDPDEDFEDVETQEEHDLARELAEEENGANEELSDNSNTSGTNTDSSNGDSSNGDGLDTDAPTIFFDPNGDDSYTNSKDNSNSGDGYRDNDTDTTVDSADAGSTGRYQRRYADNDYRAEIPATGPRHAMPDDDDDYDEDYYDNGGKSKGSGLKILAGFVAGALIVGGGFAAWQYFGSSDSTVRVASAKDYIAPEDSSDPCEPFEKLTCSVEKEFSDTPAGTLVEQSIEPGKEVEEGTSIVLKYSKGSENVTVPNVVGLSEQDAKEQLYQAGLVVSQVSKVDGDGQPGTVLEVTGVEQGAVVPNGSEVNLTVATGKIQIPDWSGKTREFVEAEAGNLGLVVTFREEESDKPSGTVISQSIKDDEVAAGDAVEVVLAKSFEDKQVEIPDVLGKSEEEAQSSLAEAGFRKITTVNVKNSDVTEKQVTQVVPGKGKKVGVESEITLIVSEPSSGGNDRDRGEGDNNADNGGNGNSADNAGSVDTPDVN